MSTTHEAQNREIERHEMPRGSFSYGQLASFDGVDAPTDAWLVCTPCSKPKRDDDNGASGFDEVLVVHFIHRDESDARSTMRNLREIGAVLVRPASSELRELHASLGMAGWGVADPNGGDYLSDGCPSAEVALAAASEVLALIARGVDGDRAREVVAQTTYAAHGDDELQS